MALPADARLLTGGGRFVADAACAAGLAHAAFLRSPHAHASIRGIDAGPARALPGVLAVLTGADALADGLGGIPWEVRPPGADPAAAEGDPAVAAPQPALAAGRVRYVGEIAAMVVAETRAAALDGCEALAVDFAPLPAVVDLEEAAARGEVGFSLEVGDAAGIAAAFARAAHVTRIALVNNRILANPIETRGCIGRYDAASGRYTLDAAAGKPHPLRDTLARFVLDCPAEALRVRVGDVGGGFGAKNPACPEQAAVLWAARRLGRPVAWIVERGEAFVSDVHGRDQINRAAAALDAEGRILAVEVETLANLGAWLAPRGANPPVHSARLIPSVYRIPALHIALRAVFTNTVPTCPVRGAGQPEGNYVVERLISAAARETGRDPVEVMRRNLIPAAAMPCRTGTGLTYDGGDFAGNLDRALALAGAESFPARRAAAAPGRRRGFGVANYLGADGFGLPERAELRLEPDGGVAVLIGSMSSGQGHAATYAMLAAERLGIAPARVSVVQGDTGLIAEGSGTGACRSLTVGGAAVSLAAARFIDAGREAAAALMEAPPEDVRYGRGAWHLVGAGLPIDLAALAAAAPSPLRAAERYEAGGFAFANGCQVCEVEVDAETGAVEIAAFTIVHDAGNAVNARVVESQLVGGAAQGIGQALGEHAVYDRETGQPLAGSFLDYPMPRAGDLPFFRVALRAGHPCRNNLLGAKSCGEAGPSGAPPAVVAAILDALAADGVRAIDMPATPARIRAAIAAAAGKRGGA